MSILIYQVPIMVLGTFFFACGPLPPVEAFSRCLFAGARVRLGRSGRRRGSARALLRALVRGLDVRIYDGYLRNLWAFPTLSSIWRNASRQGECLILIHPGLAVRPRAPRENQPPYRRRRREDLCGRPYGRDRRHVSNTRHIRATYGFRCDDL